MNEDKMRGHRKFGKLAALKFLLFGVVLFVVFGVLVMSLWNWLTPPIFGWRMINFWQALGLLVLSRILFGGFRLRPHAGGHWRGRMMERWARMTPEEREKFRQGLRHGWGPWEPPPPEPKP